MPSGRHVTPKIETVPLPTTHCVRGNVNSRYGCGDGYGPVDAPFPSPKTMEQLPLPLVPSIWPSTATGAVEISRVNAFWWCGPARKVKTTTDDDVVRRPIQSLRRSQSAHWPRGLGAQDRKPSSHTTCQHPSRRHLAKGKGPRPATASPGPKGPLSRVGLAPQQSKLGQPCDDAQHAVDFMHQSDRGSLDAYPSVKTLHSDVTAGSDKVGEQSEGARHGEVHDPATLKTPLPASCPRDRS